MANTVVGLFDDVEEAQRTVEDLTYAGFTHDDVHILGRDSLRNASALINALREGGIPGQDADYYAESVRRGSVLIAVLADEDRVPEVRDIIEQHFRQTSPSAPRISVRRVIRVLTKLCLRTRTTKRRRTARACACSRTSTPIRR